ncbi:hypothetical protein Salat_0142700 [Sesamum alatum]|uniref:Xylanase inhibitor C-terminal domain-containing protein n=1 Tax=Sesamum alatum TaxID=300844 RepID=A0AAE1YXH7_9LAMI|nr:hypothetical protein Salat_0142700 [Sesamum alatum]
MGFRMGQLLISEPNDKSYGRFSYCLPVVNIFTRTRPKTYLRFGDDVVLGRKASSTMITTVRGAGAYFVGLQGISINRKRLNISTDVFALKIDGANGPTGGCIIDSGTPYSRIVKPAYNKLKEGLENYFSMNKNLQRTTGGLGLELCYERRKPEGFKDLPDITFHLQGSKGGLVIKPEGVFEVAKKSKLPKSPEYFCLAMISSKRESIIGAY